MFCFIILSKRKEKIEPINLSRFCHCCFCYSVIKESIILVIVVQIILLHLDTPDIIYICFLFRRKNSFFLIYKLEYIINISSYIFHFLL